MTKKKLLSYICKGDKRVELKEFRNKKDTRSLSCASENDLMNLIPGSVTSLGILNNKELKVQFYIDKFYE